MHKGNVPQAIQQGDKVIIRLSAKYLAEQVAFARSNKDYRLLRDIRGWIQGEVVRIVISKTLVMYTVKSNIPRKVTGFWHFDILANSLNSSFGGIVIRKPDAAIYKGKRK